MLSCPTTANGRVSGTLGVHISYGGVDDALPRARKLGRRVAEDIRTQRRYPFQRLFDNLLSALVLKRLMRQNVLQNKDGVMKGVYEYWVSKGCIKEEG